MPFPGPGRARGSKRPSTCESYRLGCTCDPRSGLPTRRPLNASPCHPGNHRPHHVPCHPRGHPRGHGPRHGSGQPVRKPLVHGRMHRSGHPWRHGPMHPEKHRPKHLPSHPAGHPSSHPRSHGRSHRRDDRSNRPFSRPSHRFLSSRDTPVQPFPGWGCRNRRTRDRHSISASFAPGPGESRAPCNPGREPGGRTKVTEEAFPSSEPRVAGPWCQAAIRVSVGLLRRAGRPEVPVFPGPPQSTRARVHRWFRCRVGPFSPG